jgi:hypothetical protein
MKTSDCPHSECCSSSLCRRMIAVGDSPLRRDLPPNRAEWTARRSCRPSHGTVWTQPGDLASEVTTSSMACTWLCVLSAKGGVHFAADLLLKSLYTSKECAKTIAFRHSSKKLVTNSSPKIGCFRRVLRYVVCGKARQAKGFRLLTSKLTR